MVEKDGEVVREQIKDTDAMELYTFMRETLIYLTHLDCDNMERIMTEKLNLQVRDIEYSWHNLNTLCWAIGSISGALSEENEKRFLVTVIKELLHLCEYKKGKSHKAIIASNIMYIVGQYPRFLKQHWKFLKTVVNKLFEFMHESHDGVQDMACDTFIKIAQKCKKHFVTMQVGEYAPFIDEILTNMITIIHDLQPHQVHTFYEAIGHMIYAQTDPSMRAQLIKRLMENPNHIWSAMIKQAQANPTYLQQEETVQQFSSLLKMNLRACLSIRHDFIVQLQVIYMDMLLLYKTMSESISHLVQHQGENVVKAPLVKAMRIVKKDTLRLIGTWISLSDDPATVVQNFIPPLLEAVLGDYHVCIPQARDAEVLTTMAKVIDKLKGHISGQVMNVFTAVFESTLGMITVDKDTYPEHRTAFYDLLLAITEHCFDAFAQLNEKQFEMVYHAIIWGMQHLIRDVAETSLTTLKVLLDNVARVGQTNAAFAQTFYSKFYLTTMQHIFSAVTDSLHYSELDFHAQILSELFLLVETGAVTTPLNTEDPSMSNQAFLLQFVASKIKAAFGHLQDAQVAVLTQGFFSYTRDQEAFRQHLRDFIVDSKENAGEDMSTVRFLQHHVVGVPAMSGVQM